MVSVLLPVWNAGASLATALPSVSRQSLDRFECVVVDDGYVLSGAKARQEIRERLGMAGFTELGEFVCAA